MRIFDGIGIATVAIWLGIISLTAWNTYNKQPAARAQSDQVVLTEGESWMILRKNDADIGFVYESRIQLEKGWLLEYQTLISVAILGVEQTIKTTLKATVDEHAVIQNFTSDLSVMDNTFRSTGLVEGDALKITTYAGGSQSTKEIPLTKPPRLLSTAFNKIVARKDLEEGRWIEEVFFDAGAMELVEMKLQYISPSQTEVWDELYESHKFTQHVGNTKLNAIASIDGTVLIQEFPLDMIGSRVPPAIGRAKSMTLRTQANKNAKSKKDARKPVDLSLEAARQMANQFTLSAAVQGSNKPAIPGRYTFSNVSDVPTLELNSTRQYIVAHNGKSATIDTTYTHTPDTPHAPLEPEDRSKLLEISARVDGNAANIQALIQSAELEKTDDQTDQAYTIARAQKIAAAVHQAMKQAPNTDALSASQAASQALDSGQGDANQYALITVAALRQAGIPARFVHGLLYEKEDQRIPHQWIQFFDGKRFTDLDSTRNNNEMSTRHIQLFTSATPEHPDYLEALNTLSIHPTLP